MKSGLMLLLLIFCAHIGFAQKIQSSTIGAGGATTVVDGKYYSQIIGQQSAVTGTSSNGGVVVRQGFKQPTLLARSIAASGIKLNVQEENPISYTAYPNPFVDQIHFQFSKPVNGLITVTIFDLLGRLVYKEQKETTQNILTLDHLQFSQNQYLVKLSASNYDYTTQIIQSK